MAEAVFCIPFSATERETSMSGPDARPAPEPSS